MHRLLLIPISSIALLATACASREVRGGSTEPTTGPTQEARTTASDPPSEPRQSAMLEAHNVRRARHCAPPLAWSDELARAAQAWADDLARRDCAFEHSEGGLGENLWAGTAGGFSPDQIVGLWYDEVERYDFRRGRFGMDTGHFTQLVWQSTLLVGCGSSTCNGMDVWVCNYDPPGNWEGRFQENVLPATCR